jgi:transcriptional regulator with GAF, ATPase, and Fis domain
MRFPRAKKLFFSGGYAKSEATLGSELWSFRGYNEIQEEMERKQILKTLSETRWRIEGKDGAATILGFHPSTLRARMHKLGILRPEIKESN